MTCYAVYEQPAPGQPYMLVAVHRHRQALSTWLTDPQYGRTRVVLAVEEATLQSSLLVREVRKLKQQEAK